MLVVPIGDLDAEGVAAALAVVQSADLAAYPDLPPMGAEEFRLLVADDRTEGNRHLRYAAIADDGTIDVVGHLELHDDDENAHFCSAEILGAAAHPEPGRAMVETLIDVADADGRTSLMGWGYRWRAEHDFWTRLGATLRYTEQESMLVLDAVDADLMTSWIEGRLERAADVDLVEWDGACPAAHIEAFAAGRNAMNDAPTGELDINDEHFTPEDIREHESACALVGTRIHTLFAVDPSGDPVGHTTVHVNTHRPAASWQWDTAVVGHHRRRGVGRWLKAEMWRTLRNAFPEVTHLRTGNADNNAAMLAINVAMGYRPTHLEGGWQADLSDYRDALERG